MCQIRSRMLSCYNPVTNFGSMAYSTIVKNGLYMGHSSRARARPCSGACTRCAAARARAQSHRVTRVTEWILISTFEVYIMYECGMVSMRSSDSSDSNYVLRDMFATDNHVYSRHFGGKCMGLSLAFGGPPYMCAFCIYPSVSICIYAFVGTV